MNILFGFCLILLATQIATANARHPNVFSKLSSLYKDTDEGVPNGNPTGQGDAIDTPSDPSNLKKDVDGEVSNENPTKQKDTTDTLSDPSKLNQDVDGGIANEGAPKQIDALTNPSDMDGEDTTEQEDAIGTRMLRIRKIVDNAIKDTAKDVAKDTSGAVDNIAVIIKNAAVDIKKVIKNTASEIGSDGLKNFKGVVKAVSDTYRTLKKAVKGVVVFTGYEIKTMGLLGTLVDGLRGLKFPSLLDIFAKIANWIYRCIVKVLNFIWTPPKLFTMKVIDH